MGSRLVVLLFFLSGLSGLVYEVVWTRLLVLVMGSTVFSVTTVLTSFMGGLALGSFLGGRYADRLASPVRAYGILEAAIGAFGLAAPFLVRALKPLYAALYSVAGDSALAFGFCQFLVAGLVLLVPSTLMGATLPILARASVRSMATVGRSVGGLYSVNTFGAVAGALLTGFVLVPALGILGTTFFAATLNAAIAAAALALAKSAPKMVPGTISEMVPGTISAGKKMVPGTISSTESVALPWLLLAFGMAGFASMVDQVAWTRVLSLLLGSTVYAFSLMVGAFILGLALGGAAVSAFVDRIARPVSALATAQCLVAATTALLLPVFGLLPRVVLALTRSEGESFATAQLTRFGVIFACLLVPTALMGAAFPLVTRIAARERERIGRTVGSAYAANTLGAILGSCAGGFALVPFLGLRESLLCASMLNLVTAIVLWSSISPTSPASAPFSRWRRYFAPVGATGLVLVLVATLAPWDTSALSSGIYLYGVRSRDDAASSGRGADAASPAADDVRWGELVYYKEGMTATVSVRRAEDGTVALQTNGKTDASNGFDMRTQVLLAHLPVAIARGGETALVIGLGSGVTAGSIARYPSFRSIDCVEISAEIVEAARLFFSEANHGVLSDPRLRLVVGDGRIFVDLEAGSYDVITSEPSNLWIAGIGNLFSREFFAMCAERLRPGGVMGQWLHAYDLRPEDFRTVVRTFLAVFPEASLYELGYGADYLLVGTREPQSIDVGRLAARLAEPAIAADLSRIAIRDAGDVLSTFIAGSGALRRFAGEGEVHTDDNGLLEYAAPRTLHHSQSERNVAALAPVFEPIDPYLAGDAAARSAVTEEIGRRRRARELLVESERLGRSGREAEAMEAWGRALRDLPDWLEFVRGYADYEMNLAAREIGEGRPGEAIVRAERVLALDPRNVDALNVRGHGFLTAGDAAAAIPLFEAVLELRPKSPDAALNLSTAYIRRERYDDAVRVIDGLGRGALGADLYFNRGMALSGKGDVAGAIRDFESSLRLRPDEATRAALEAARASLRR